MALTTTNYTLNSYTNATWTDLVNVSNKSTIATLVIANTTGSAISGVQVRLTDDTPTELAIILPSTSIDANTAQVLDLRSINVSGSQRIQVQAATAGIDFTASGVEET